MVRKFMTNMTTACWYQMPRRDLQDVFAELAEVASAPIHPAFRSCAHIERVEYGAIFCMQPCGLVRDEGAHFRYRRFAGETPRANDPNMVVRVDFAASYVLLDEKIVGVLGCLTFGACMQSDEIRYQAFGILIRDLRERLMVALRNHMDIFPPKLLQPFIEVADPDELLELFEAAAAARPAGNEKPTLH
jgi:hypothetical protein